jgi:hypothetical protein
VLCRPFTTVWMNTKAVTSDELRRRPRGLRAGPSQSRSSRPPLAARKGLSRRGKVPVAACQISIRVRASAMRASMLPGSMRRRGRRRDVTHLHQCRPIIYKRKRRRGNDEMAAALRLGLGKGGIGRPSHGPAKVTSGFVFPNPVDDL